MHRDFAAAPAICFEGMILPVPVSVVSHLFFKMNRLVQVETVTKGGVLLVTLAFASSILTVTGNCPALRHHNPTMPGICDA